MTVPKIILATSIYKYAVYTNNSIDYHLLI